MRRNLMTLATLIGAAALAGSVLAQQGRGSASAMGPTSGTGRQVDPTKVTNVTGDVVKFTGGPGQGMPTLVLNVGGKEESFVLGSYRYLASQKFSPAAGDRLHLVLWACEACPQGNAVAEIQNVRTGDVLKLRAADGSPLFAGPGTGRGMRGRGMQGGRGPMDGSGPNPNCPYKTGS